MSRYSNHTCDRCGLMYSQLGKAHSACPQCVIHKVEDSIEAVDEIAPDKLPFRLE
jgi:predicted  nucleic acid-binding Zn-ribbon protein